MAVVLRVPARWGGAWVVRKVVQADAQFESAQHGENGLWVSELMPHSAANLDQLCMVRSMHTEAINHDPAITFFLTGSQIAGRPSMGAWMDNGLGSTPTPSIRIYKAQLRAYFIRPKAPTHIEGAQMEAAFQETGTGLVVEAAGARNQGPAAKNNWPPSVSDRNPVGI